MEHIFEKNGRRKRVIFRAYENRDFPQYVRCVQAFYKDGYPYREYLDENFISQEIAARRLLLTVGELKDGDLISVMGAVGKEGCFENSILLTLRNVIPAYSGGGIASSQLDDLMERLPKIFPDAESVYADVMTYNGVSQHSVMSRGYTLCGLRLMLYKNERIVPTLTYEPNTKMTQSVYCASLKKESARTIYAPKAHEAWVKERYRQLGVSLTVLPVDKNAYEPENLWYYESKAEHEKAEWVIQKAAVDFEEGLKESLKEFDGMEHGTAVAYLNMASPSFGVVYAFFRKKGFYFCGIKPLNREGEYLMLAHTVRCLERYEDIVLEQGGEELLNYILEKRDVSYEEELSE